MKQTATLQRYRQALEFSQRQATAVLARQVVVLPDRTRNGKWLAGDEQAGGGRNGYLAGMLWQFARLNGESHWREQARRCARAVAQPPLSANTEHPALAMLLSHRPWFELERNTQAQQTMFEAGMALIRQFQHCGRFFALDAEVTTLSITTLLDVPLLQLLADATLDQDLARFVVAHGRTTRDRLVHDDGSAEQQVRYDAHSGKFDAPATAGDGTDNCCRSRSLAWSLYGFTNLYALTRATEFLRVAERNAEYWLGHLPPGRIPTCDLTADAHAPQGIAVNDSTAAAIAASGMLDLARVVPEPARAIVYRTMAMATLDALVEPDYLAELTPDWEGILRCSVPDVAGDRGVDESTAMGDYFFVEALSKVLLKAGP